MSRQRVQGTLCPLLKRAFNIDDDCHNCRFYRGETRVIRMRTVSCNYPRDGSYLAKPDEEIPPVKQEDLLSTRQRVNRLKKSDPLFFEAMLVWREQFKANHKKNWLDRPLKRRFLTADGRIVKRYETGEMLLAWIAQEWEDSGERWKK